MNSSINIAVDAQNTPLNHQAAVNCTMSMLNSLLRIPCCFSLVLLSLQGGVTHQKQSEVAFAPPSPPQFSNEPHWASLPWRLDPSDEIPRNLPVSAVSDSLNVDVFFVHPTQYFKGPTYNADIEDEDLNQEADRYTMRLQALSLIHI